ncbi:semaphorin-1A isoform X2 [Wyeomyia smithii]|uniref:semaphorin-1A isoform X2 n=1 Tax=Wyeomyia smithii TaxID=174621 RepID=UPI002467D211|nr:semaphorin-1A isoform X2 [Wyeomyia smithii]
MMVLSSTPAATLNRHLTRIVTVLIVLISCSLDRTDSWTPDVLTKSYITYDNTIPAFFGNSTDYFKLLHQDDSSILIGARNALYNISLDRLIENANQRVTWSSSDAHRELCTLKGKQDQDCQNYIRVYARVGANRIMLCGTNSYKPLCRYYNVLPSDGAIIYDSNEMEALGRCPYNPLHNSTYVYTDGHLYSATVADFSGADPLIYREPQRTEQYDSKQLNQPAFVSAVEHNGYVLFFFREVAVEYMNCGKAIYSRVSRVCKNDKGGPHPLNDRWTSFLKARLNCSIPGDYPFYFDEIQSTTKTINGIYGGQSNQIIYAIMTTPENAIGGSAVCAFSIQDILDTFEGPFKSQRDSHSNWLQVPQSQVPEPRPGKCVDDSRTLPKASVNFVKMNTLMDMPVQSLHSRPVFTRVSLLYRLSAITVDSQVKALDGTTHDVVFVGTNDGKVIKFVNILSANTTEDVKTVVISETQAFPLGNKVNEMTISRKNKKLIVISNGKIISLPLSNCNEHEFKSCRKCLELQDPYCGWDDVNRECRSVEDARVSGHPIENLFQRLDGTGVNEICKKYDQRDQRQHKVEDNDVYTRVDGSGSAEKEKSSETKNVVIIQSSRGTVSSIGPSDIDNEIRDMTSIEGSVLTNKIGTHQYHHKTDPFVKENIASASLRWEFTIMLILIGILLGGLFGGFATQQYMKKQPFHGSSEHRNQLNWHPAKNLSMLSQNRTSGKDVNLLMNTTNQYHTQHQAIVQQLQQQQNNMKDNIDFDYKDRSVECKNSTENLEKDISKGMGTLQKTRQLKTFKP